MSQDNDIKRDDPMIAAEYSLGLLEGEELLNARGKEATDANFAWRKAWWDNWFAPFTDEMPGLKAGDHVWQNIAAEIERIEAAKVGTSAQVIELQAKVTRWKWTAGLTSAAAALAIAFVAIPKGEVPDPAGDGAVTLASASPLVATVPIGDTGLRLDLTYMPESEKMLVAAIGLTADGVHDHELWLVPADGSALQSLGVVAPGEVRMMELSPDIIRNLNDGVDLVLTREPIGGKPEGVDAGPVVASGEFSQV